MFKWMRKHFVLTGVLIIATVAIAYAGTVSIKPYGIATPYWYGYSSGAKSSYYLGFPTLTGNDTVTGIATSQTITNKTISGASNTISNIGNSSLSAPNSYFTVALSVNGQESATVDPAAVFQMPFAATLVEVSVGARDIDTGDGNETYTVDLEESGTSVLDSAISITADATPVVGTISDDSIADNAKLEVVLTLGGTSPAIDDLTVLLTFKVAHTS